MFMAKHCNVREIKDRFLALRTAARRVPECSFTPELEKRIARCSELAWEIANECVVHKTAAAVAGEELRDLQGQVRLLRWACGALGLLAVSAAALAVAVTLWP